ncbi:MAG: DUF1638 domain-containing protein [Oscillospiraceae bacterium]|nr:DUF1638 domain-containing protein [Oscillospiraceae bacterium]
MKLMLVCCEVFTREACRAIAGSPNVVDVVFTPKGAHNDSAFLNRYIRKVLDGVEGAYDAVIMGFALCGNGLLGIGSDRYDLIIPRAHDCCAIFMGSNGRFREAFGDRLSSEWCSTGYMERGTAVVRDSGDGPRDTGFGAEYAELVERYGEENAAYLWETLHPERKGESVVYIDVPGIRSLEGEAMAIAEKEGKALEVLRGDSRLIDMLVDGVWPDCEFLTVPKGGRIAYDHRPERIMTVG